MPRKSKIPSRNAKFVTYGYTPGGRSTSVVLEFEDDGRRIEVNLDADSTSMLVRDIKEILEFAWRDGRQPIDYKPGEAFPFWLYSNHLQVGADMNALHEKQKADKESNLFGLNTEQWKLIDQAGLLLHQFKHFRNAAPMQKWKAEFERLARELAIAGVPAKHPTNDVVVMTYVKEIFPLFLGEPINA